MVITNRAGGSFFKESLYFSAELALLVRIIFWERLLYLVFAENVIPILDFIVFFINFSDVFIYL